MTGSLRYMAPEVALHGTPYNEKCDVHSYAHVLWEMLALQRAYVGLAATQERFITEVFLNEKRPPIKASWPRRIQELLRRGWCPDPRQRLSAEQCHDLLRAELVSMRHGDDTGLEHVKRRSTFLHDESAREVASSPWTFYRPRKSASTTDISTLLAADDNNASQTSTNTTASPTKRFDWERHRTASM